MSLPIVVTGLWPSGSPAPMACLAAVTRVRCEDWKRGIPLAGGDAFWLWKLLHGARRRQDFAVRCGGGGAEEHCPKLVTFVGKGGAGKTHAAVLAAQDPTVNFLLGQKLSSAPSSFCNGALTALRLESTKMLLDPLAQLKKADAQLNFSQGALNEVVGEELSVLPGMDPYLALGALEQLTAFSGGLFKAFGKSESQKYDVIVFDGTSSEEIFRMFGVAGKARYYLRLVRNVAEKTDAGRVALPSVLRLVESAFFQGSEVGKPNKTTAEIWDAADGLLGKVMEAYSNPKRFTCFLVVNPNNKLTTEAALRYWGCAMQAGIYVAGVWHSPTLVSHNVIDNFSPLPVADLPVISTSLPDWVESVRNLSEQGKILLDGKSPKNKPPQPVVFDKSVRTVTLFLPGFHKAEVKLSQVGRHFKWRGGSELLVEAGDQRRIIALPPDMRGKVAGAKFLEKTLVVSIRDR